MDEGYRRNEWLDKQRSSIAGETREGIVDWELRHRVSAAAIVGTLVLIVICGDWGKWGAAGWKQAILALLFGAWLIGPPIWFLWDWKRMTPVDETDFKHFKHSQELAKNLWIAVSVALGLLLGFKPG